MCFTTGLKLSENELLNVEGQWLIKAIKHFNAVRGIVQGKRVKSIKGYFTGYSYQFDVLNDCLIALPDNKRQLVETRMLMPDESEIHIVANAILGFHARRLEYNTDEYVLIPVNKVQLINEHEIVAETFVIPEIYPRYEEIRTWYEMRQAIIHAGLKAVSKSDFLLRVHHTTRDLIVENEGGIVSMEDRKAAYLLGEYFLSE